MSLGSRWVDLQSLSFCCFPGLSGAHLVTGAEAVAVGSCRKGADPKSCLIPNCGSSEGPLHRMKTPARLLLPGVPEAQMKLSTHPFPLPPDKPPHSWMRETTSSAVTTRRERTLNK